MTADSVVPRSCVAEEVESARYKAGGAGPTRRSCYRATPLPCFPVISHETRRRSSMLQQSPATTFYHPAVSSDSCYVQVFISIGAEWGSSSTCYFRFLFYSLVVLPTCVWQQSATNYWSLANENVKAFFYPALSGTRRKMFFEGFQYSSALPSDKSIIHLSKPSGFFTYHQVWPFKDEAQAALFKDPVRTTQ